MYKLDNSIRILCYIIFLVNRVIVKDLTFSQKSAKIYVTIKYFANNNRRS